MLIDDFSNPDGLSALATSWQGFSDRVMGGVSDLQAGYAERDGQTVMVLRGQVRLENNGGFIQVRLPLDARGRDFDASAFAGLQLRARAVRPGPYYVHLRSADTRRPWSYYRAVLELGQDWTTIDVPFSAFEPRSVNADLDTGRLRSLAVVAYGEAFDAHLEVSAVRLVPSP